MKKQFLFELKTDKTYKNKASQIMNLFGNFHLKNKSLTVTMK